MAKIKIFGIRNCNTMKKAFDWFDDNDIEYDFHDYKKYGANLAILEKSFEQHGWESTINRRGMTWRKLPDDVKESMSEEEAKDVANEKPSVIKRPLVLKSGDITLGFDENEYQEKFL